MVNLNGELVGLTYQREQQVTAWHRHIFGGRFGNATITNASITSLAAALDANNQNITNIISSR